MRGLSRLLKRRETAAALPSGRPETLRRATLAANARFILVAAALAGVPALYLIVSYGLLVPAVLSILGIAAGSASLAWHRLGHHDRAAASQVHAILAAGLVLTAVDPALADFGLAIALLGPIYAAMMARPATTKRAWGLLVGVVAVGALGAQGLSFWPEPHNPGYTLIAAVGFAFIALVVAHAANRLNSLFEVYDRGQINAYRHLIEHLRDAVMQFGVDGTVLFTSRSAETLFGCRRFELGGQRLLDRIHVLDRPAYLTAFADANIGGRPRVVEVRMRRDGEGAVPTFIWVEASLSPVIDAEAGGDRNEVVALFRDVTERKDSELQLHEARTAAEAASQGKSRFLATIGHELRTPLNAIVGFSEMMTSGVVGEPAPAHREYAELIHKSGLHLLDVIGMLLDMSRIEAGKFELQTEGFRAAALLEPCLRMVEHPARERDIRLTTEIAGDLPEIIADERACRQILINLLSNAVKFSKPGGEVTVSLRRQARFLSLAVKDRGIGMPADALKQIGEPFFQVHNGLARGYEGTGLGLSIVKGLVDLHQGEMHTRSAPGEGTTVTVLLPLNGPVVKSVDTGAVTQLHRGPHGTTQEEEVDDSNRPVATAAAGR